MLSKSDNALTKKAFDTVKKVTDNQFGNVVVGHVAAALVTSKGNIYTGVNMECKCDIGSCAEHHAIADMIKNNEHDIKTIVAVNRQGEIVPPCGRCRELIYQVTHNHDAEILVPEGKKLRLKDLLPKIWEETYYNSKK